ETLEAITGVTDDEKSKYDEVGTDSGDSRVKASTDSLNSYANQVKSLLAVNSPASCPADISISLLGRSIIVPISKVCPLFVLMRYLLALLVDLACLRILYKSFVGD
ncbi:MAG TPA: hypothetical protein PKL36_13480, partial [Agitococcus sp.]|nr:hypothetical protein [Agitococcus sp.]